MGIDFQLNQPAANFLDEPLRTQLYEHLLNSELFSIYRSSYENLTGHTLSLVHPVVEETPYSENSRCNNAYCSILLKTNACSKRCFQNAAKLSKKATKTAVTKTCDGGITSSIIPIRIPDAQKSVVAYLRTGLVKIQEKKFDQAQFDALTKDLPESVAEDLIKSFKEQREINKDDYHNQLVLIGAFSMHLGAIAQKGIGTSSEDSVLTSRCKHYIQDHLREKICLAAMADHAKVTDSYMCKQFKKHTGMTIVEYINVHRIDLAKKLLLERSDEKVIEIAYDCGFQSLSQFNRTFRKFTDSTPSDYRKEANLCSSGLCS